MAKGIVPLLVALAAILALAGCGGSKTISENEFADSVVNTRDRADYALAQITKQKTREAFLEQMTTSADLIDDAADDFESAGTADGFDDEAESLTDQLFQLGADLRGTSEQIQIPGYEGLLNAKGISFESWKEINKILASLNEQGIKVAPLARH